MEALYQKYKGLLFRLAYQMTGSAADAEDIVQDVFLKVHDVKWEQIEEPKAYLCKMTTNRCLDLLKSARKKRELYTGPWLPEPVSATYTDSYESVLQKDLLSYAMLVLLERLSPGERAVFVLREALAFDYHDIAALVGKSEANCRKIISRAKSKMGLAPDEPIPADDKEISHEWFDRFLSALANGKIDTLLTLLANDAELISDGGGKVSAALRPIVTGERVAQFLFGIMRKFVEGEELRVELVALNGGQTALALYLGGRLDSVTFLHVEQEAIRHLYLVRNPDKLKYVEGSINPL
ncbi:RNA polymerase sigma-70 factor [Brevibacillus choshinensis]|uniref:RNA polymerase sigma-70 factor n=1 Tax=Brevibacillus choshinensis TaxID=54911 RepID=A0ABX7FYB8_BRECH|nr:RNA polymerase sigma-70 factor [Brevibacillus choshinensis]QRG70806.1 RNA polymerase sigma-70 factor [Brevibacillus choshinensis]